MIRQSESQIKKDFASPRESESFFFIFDSIRRIEIRESEWKLLNLIIPVRCYSVEVIKIVKINQSFNNIIQIKRIKISYLQRVPPVGPQWKVKKSSDAK